MRAKLPTRQIATMIPLNETIIAAALGGSAAVIPAPYSSRTMSYHLLETLAGGR
jgi:hypothetical protein